MAPYVLFLGRGDESGGASFGLAPLVSFSDAWVDDAREVSQLRHHFDAYNGDAMVMAMLMAMRMLSACLFVVAAVLGGVSERWRVAERGQPKCAGR